MPDLNLVIELQHLAQTHPDLDAPDYVTAWWYARKSWVLDQLGHTDDAEAAHQHATRLGFTDDELLTTTTSWTPWPLIDLNARSAA